MKKSSYIVKASLIAAIYVIITGLFAPISFGHGIFQLRISEALTVLPIYTSAAIPGLFVGCMMSNLIFGGLGIIDLIFGSLATLIASYLTYKLKNKGKIAVGYDADLTLIDLKQEGKFDIDEFKTKAEYSPFDGWKYIGMPIMTIVNGKVVMDKLNWFFKKRKN